MDIKFLLADTRSRVYLVWAVLVPLGFVANHYFQVHAINIVWTAISLIGLGFMLKVMPLRVKQMQHIFLAWLLPITYGMCASGAVFYVHGAGAANLLAHLGAFWLAVMAVAYLLNGLVDRPMGWYIFAAVINAAASILCFTNPAFTEVQYLVAAIITAWSMLNLLLFRTDVLS